MGSRSNVVMVRWRKGESRRRTVYRMGLSEGHPAYNAMCLLCAHKLSENVAGEGVQIVALHPVKEFREHFAEGRFTRCFALILHTWCVDRQLDAALDELAGCVRIEEETEEEGDRSGVS